MLEILKFLFGNFYTWVGLIVFTAILLEGIASIVRAFRCRKCSKE